MRYERYLTACSVVIISALLTAVVREILMAYRILDVPNSRSSHFTPTVRGGGVAIVVTTIAAIVVLPALRTTQVAVPLIIGGLAVATVGLIDDFYHVSIGIRFAVHIGSATLAVASLGGFPPLQIGDQIIAFGWLGYFIGIIGIVWFLNLFNFMDGIDGIAASEAAFICFGGALLVVCARAAPEIQTIWLIMGAGCAGFLLWNWPPARIFMGDVGSGYIGYVIAVLALAAGRNNPVFLWAWLILGSIFFVDASVTLLRRVGRGERFYEAHRSHAYQRLSRRWGSHGRVTVGVLAVNMTWLLPNALLADAFPREAMWIAAVAIAPIVVIVVWAGAGSVNGNGSPGADSRVSIIRKL